MAETIEKEPTLVESFAGLSGESIATALMDSMNPKASDVPASNVKESVVPSKEATDKLPDEKATDKISEDQVVVDNTVIDKKDEKTGKSAENAVGDKDKKKEDIVVEVTTEEEKEPVLEFKLPDSVKKEGEEPAVESNGWKDLAKEFEIEINEDKFEEFKEKLDIHYKNKYEINLGKYNAETQAVIEALEAGMTIDEYVKPTEGIDRLIALDDVAIVTADLKARKFPEDKIEKEVARLEELDQLDLYAINIRESLENKKAEIQSNIIKSKTNAKERQNTYKNNVNAEQSAAIKNALNTVSEFMGTPLKADVKEFIMSKEQKGEYANLFNDPKVKAEFLLWHEFGKAAVTNLKQKSYYEGVMKYKNDRHNIPPLTGVGGTGVRSASQTTIKAEGNWDALKGFTSL